MMAVMSAYDCSGDSEPPAGGMDVWQLRGKEFEEKSTVPDGCDGEPEVLHSENSERAMIDHSTMADEEEADVAAMLDLSNKKMKKKDKTQKSHREKEFEEESTVPDGCDGEPEVLHSENSERAVIYHSTMGDEEEADVAAMLDLSNNNKKTKKDKNKPKTQEYTDALAKALGESDDNEWKIQYHCHLKKQGGSLAASPSFFLNCARLMLKNDKVLDAHQNCHELPRQEHR
jgi:hypothetical protein